MPDLIETGECPTPETFNAWFTDLDARLAVLEAGSAASLAGYLKADGSVAVTAPLNMVSGTPSAPNDLARLTDIPDFPDFSGGIETGVTTSTTIAAPVGAAVVVSARSDVLSAYVSDQTGTVVTISVVDLAGDPDATSVDIDWVAVAVSV